MPVSTEEQLVLRVLEEGWRSFHGGATKMNRPLQAVQYSSEASQVSGPFRWILSKRLQTNLRVQTPKDIALQPPYLRQTAAARHTLKR